jgi:hypothetical protein
MSKAICARGALRTTMAGAGLTATGLALGGLAFAVVRTASAEPPDSAPSSVSTPVEQPTSPPSAATTSPECAGVVRAGTCVVTLPAGRGGSLSTVGAGRSPAVRAGGTDSAQRHVDDGHSGSRHPEDDDRSGRRGGDDASDDDHPDEPDDSDDRDDRDDRDDPDDRDADDDSGDD